MAGYDYVAINGRGHPVRGRLSAESETAARNTLARRNMVVVEIAPSSAKARSAKTSGRLSAKALALVTRQLATLVSVSPLEEALRTLVAQADRPHPT